MFQLLSLCSSLFSTIHPVLFKKPSHGIPLFKYPSLIPNLPLHTHAQSNSDWPAVLGIFSALPVAGCPRIHLDGSSWDQSSSTPTSPNDHPVQGFSLPVPLPPGSTSRLGVLVWGALKPSSSPYPTIWEFFPYMIPPPDHNLLETQDSL